VSANAQGGTFRKLLDKGKIEKRFDYFQRRLPTLCERYGITDVGQARTRLEDLVGYYNEQRRHQETEAAQRWQDGLRRGQGRSWPVSAPAGTRVTVCWRPDEQLVMLWNGQKVGAYAL
jgi:hypothetical protein